MSRPRFRKRAALACLVAATTSALAQNPAATVQVDANANRKPISPLIYGVNWADQSALDELNLTLNRRGGNATTTYNWQINATNRGGDWFYESHGDDGGATPGASADNFIDAAKATAAEPMMTVPMVDWVAKVGPNRQALTAYSVAKYGAQTRTNPWWPDSGNGIRVSDGLRINDNDPNDRASLLRFDAMQAIGNDMRLTFPSVPGRIYRVERSDTLLEGSWTTVQDDIAGTGAPIQITDPSGALRTKRFYRIAVEW